MINALEETFNLIFTSGLFSVWLAMFMVLIAFKIALRIFRYVEFDGFTFQKEPDTQEKEITFYDLLYDDELKELMAKYDELDEHHKKKHKKQKGEY